MSIIIPQAFLLSLPSSLQRPFTHTRIGFQTFTRGLSPSLVAASSETIEGPSDAPLRPDTFEFWQALSLPAIWDVDLGVPRIVDYVGVVGTIGSSGAAIKISYETEVGDPPVLSFVDFSTETAPPDDSPLMFLDEAVFARKWRITLTGGLPAGGGALDVPQISVVYIGLALAMERSIYGGHSPLPLSRDTVLKRALSRGGRFLGQNFQRNGVQGGFSYRNLTPEFIRDEFDPFVLSVRRFPAFFAWRPLDFPSEVVYGWVIGDIAPLNMGQRDLMQVDFSVRGIGHND